MTLTWQRRDTTGAGRRMVIQRSRGGAGVRGHSCCMASSRPSPSRPRPHRRRSYEKQRGGGRPKRVLDKRQGAAGGLGGRRLLVHCPQQPRPVASLLLALASPSPISSSSSSCSSSCVVVATLRDPGHRRPSRRRGEVRGAAVPSGGGAGGEQLQAHPLPRRRQLGRRRGE